MGQLTTTIVCSLILQLVWTSPFEVTEQYIQSYKVGIAHLKREAHEYVPHERSFEEEYKHAEPHHDEDEYDFIIVGGGTSGAVIASRLSEVPEYKVLLLEAGAGETEITKIPAMSEVVRHTHNNWGYLSEPQKTWCLGDEHHQCRLRGGKILGGSSSVNDLIYIRGNARDYDLWADNGNDEWCWNHVLPYFMKSEDAHLHSFDRKHHYQGGRLHVEDPQYLSALHEHWLHAGKELKYDVLDYNGKSQMGFSVPQMNTKDGRRFSSFQAFLGPYYNRKNLVVLPKSHVIEVLISEHTKEAQGVKYVHGEHIKVAKAKKEIILTGGAINSAHLLLLSGVGPKAALKEKHIECKADLPVGLHLKDHLTFPGLNYYYNHSKVEEDPEHNLVDYLKNSKGPLTVTGPEGLAFLKTKVSTDTAHYPDVYLTFVPNVYHGNFRIKVTGAHPKSEGSVSLKAKDPLHWPAVDPNHLSDEDDMDIVTMLAGVRLAQKMVDTESFKKLGAHIDESKVHGCEDYEFNSDDYWKCAIRHISYSEGDYTGTCIMGPKPEKYVVDSKLRVHGIHKLRVADASVIPLSITGNTLAVNVMIGEKASDLIRNMYELAHKQARDGE